MKFLHQEGFFMLSRSKNQPQCGHGMNSFPHPFPRSVAPKTTNKLDENKWTDDGRIVATWTLEGGKMDEQRDGGWMIKPSFGFNHTVFIVFNFMNTVRKEPELDAQRSQRVMSPPIGNMIVNKSNFSRCKFISNQDIQCNTLGYSR